jgi:cytoskeleton protein RodZ
MSERAEEASPIDPNASAAPGQRLKAERERRGLNTQQVANDLHVDVSTIEALEAGRLASLGAPVHVKGHLRKYAMLLGLDAEPLLAAWEITQPPVPELVPLRPATRPARFRVSRSAIVILVAGVTASALVWLLANRKEARPPEPRQSVVESPPAAVEASPAAEAVVETQVAPSATPAAETGVEKQVAASTSPAAVTLPEAASSGEVRAAAARVRIRMSFTSDSWVEIYDSAEQRVFFDMGATGTSRAVSADAPLRVFLGYADGVSLELDGQAVAVPAEVRRGNLAEFSLDKRGHVSPRRQR